MAPTRIITPWAETDASVKQSSRIFVWGISFIRDQSIGEYQTKLQTIGISENEGAEFDDPCFHFQVNDSLLWTGSSKHICEF